MSKGRLQLRTIYLIEHQSEVRRTVAVPVAKRCDEFFLCIRRNRFWIRYAYTSQILRLESQVPVLLSTPFGPL
jgi:hypothetical protein